MGLSYNFRANNLIPFFDYNKIFNDAYIKEIISIEQISKLSLSVGLDKSLIFQKL